jgi:hypothetical protein
MMFVTSPGYTYNGSPNITVDAMPTEFSGSTNRKNFFSTDIHCPPAYFNSHVDAVH